MARIRVGTGAAIYLQSRSKHYWYDDWRDRSRRIRVPLGTSDAAEALEKAKVIFNDQTKPTLTIEEALEKYEEDYERRNRKSSLQRTMPVVKHFAAFVGPERCITELNRRHLVDWRDKRAETVSKATTNSDLTRAKGFVNYCRAEGWIEGDPTLKIRCLKTSSIAKESVSPAVVSKLLEAFEGHWLFDYTTVLANVGLRPQEALHIRVCDVDTEKELLRIRAYPGWEIKDHEDRTLALNKLALAALLRRRLKDASPDSLLFPSPMGLLWNYHNFADIWRTLKPKDVKVAPYDMRHYFASRCVAQGWKIEKLSRYLGHANVATTQKYYVDVRALCEIGAPPITLKEREAQ